MIEFSEPSLWQNYRVEIVFAALVIMVQLVLIGSLAYALRKRRIAEQGLMDQANALGEQINLFESVINSIPDAIMISNVEREIYSVNRSVRNLFGLEPSEVVGKKTFTLLKSWSAGINAEAKYASSDHEYIKPVILEYKKRNGEVFSGETIETKIISSQGEELGYFTLVRNVSRRLVKEAEAKQSQKMEALGNLVGGIAHDFNNILGMITAHAEVLQLQSKDLGGREGLKKIVKATDRGAAVCSQILAFSRDTGVEQTKVDLLEVVKETLKLLTVSIPNRINIRLNCYGNLFLANANFTQIQQVIMNLANNSSQAIGQRNGAIEITLSNDQFDHEQLLFQSTLPAGEYVCLSVRDTGGGISEEVLQKIFEPFFSTKAQDHGAGMGMAMVYSIINSHRGFIDIKPTEEVGTEVRVFLPALQVAPSLEVDGNEPDIIRGKGERVLLVDDEVDLLESVEQLFINIGYEVVAFNVPEQAVEYFEEHHADIDILVSDQSMPGHSGAELVALCRAIKPALPAILCTGYSEILDSQSIAELSINAVVRKPFTIAAISVTMAQAISPPSTFSSQKF